ncbi:hypothetical protein DKX38_024237 [Salix brachista]|uniref:DUF4283 domain-containing protein n=1 Tax=Salix brachista TaxID=2182728 RepID=A0A5N5JKW0_9ROSI|nr:hypothetical protein DKX38_024237 [Salix brachista]
MTTHTQPATKATTTCPKIAPASQSWAEKVHISDSTTHFILDPIQRNKGGNQLRISDEVLHHSSDQWNRCMVDFIPGFRMSHRMVNTIASRVWRSCGLEQATTMANDFMLFMFKTEPEMQAVMEKGPWLFGGKAIMLQQWHPSYKFDKDRISKLLVWIRLQGLPFPLWTQAGLNLAASMVGCPLSCDSQTYNCTRLEYARLCVEIDVSLPKVTHFEIVSPLSADPIAVEVEYEWLPPHCSQCKLYGHSCKNPNKQPNPNPQPTPNNTQLNPNTQPYDFVNPSTSKMSGKCTMSTMDSETHEASSASGTNFDNHNTSPPSSPKIARKKKGVKKKKAAQGC